MKCSEPLISFIIPVYNLEKYIVNLLNEISLVNNTNFEFIFIDDGSKDRSLEILTNFCRSDARCSVFSKENGGVSSARNLGLKKALGKFVSFIDGDDSVNLKILVDNMDLFTDEVDLLIWGMKTIINHSEEVCLLDSFKGNTVDDLVKYSICTGELNSCWAKFYKASIINEHMIEFPEEVKIGEDKLFVLRYLEFCDSFRIIKKPFYIYLRRDSSAMGQANESRFHDIAVIYKVISKYVDKDTSAEIIFDDIASTLFFAGHQLSIDEMKGIFIYVYSNEFDDIWGRDISFSNIERKALFRVMQKKKIQLPCLYIKLRSTIIDFMRGKL